METSERDLLIKIDTKLTEHIAHYGRVRDEDLIRIAEANRKSDKAHERIDKIIVIGGLTLFVTVGGLILTVVRSFGGTL